MTAEEHDTQTEHFKHSSSSWGESDLANQNVTGTANATENHVLVLLLIIWVSNNSFSLKLKITLSQLMSINKIEHQKKGTNLWRRIKICEKAPSSLVPAF